MKRHKTELLFLLLPLVFCSSCLEIYEVIRIKDKGKGNVEIGLDMGSAGILGSLTDRYLQPGLMDEITAMPALAANRLKDVEGVKNVMFNPDLSKGKLFVSFDFENRRAINKAYFSLFFREKKWYEPRPILLNNHRFKRYNLTPLIKYFIGDNKTKLNDLTLLGLIKVRSEIHIPKPAKSVSNQAYTILPDKQSIQMVLSLQELLGESPSTGIKVRF